MKQEDVPRGHHCINVYIFVKFVYVYRSGILVIICTVWLDWNTVEEDSSHRIERMIEQNYVDTKNVWRQGDTVLYNQKNGTYLTVEEYENIKAKH